MTDYPGGYRGGPTPQGKPPIPPLFAYRPAKDAHSADQPLGEHPDLTMPAVAQAIDRLRDLERENVALKGQVYGLKLKLDAAVAESHTWRMRASGSELAP